VLGAFANAFRTPDLRRKLLFVLLIVTIFRLGSQVPAPGVNVQNVQGCFQQISNEGLYGMINLFSGGALLQLTIFALGIMPYITASIILQLLVVVIPRLETLKNEGWPGRPRSRVHPLPHTCAGDPPGDWHHRPRPQQGAAAELPRRAAVPRGLALDDGRHGHHDDGRHRGDHVAR
jgi:hypothetical protein